MAKCQRCSWGFISFILKNYQWNVGRASTLWYLWDNIRYQSSGTLRLIKIYLKYWLNNTGILYSIKVKVAVFFFKNKRRNHLCTVNGYNFNVLENFRVFWRCTHPPLWSKHCASSVFYLWSLFWLKDLLVRQAGGGTPRAKVDVSAVGVQRGPSCLAARLVNLIHVVT